MRVTGERGSMPVQNDGGIDAQIKQLEKQKQKIQKEMKQLQDQKMIEAKMQQLQQLETEIATLRSVKESSKAVAAISVSKASDTQKTEKAAEVDPAKPEADQYDKDVVKGQAEKGVYRLENDDKGDKQIRYVSPLEDEGGDDEDEQGEKKRKNGLWLAVTAIEDDPSDPGNKDKARARLVSMTPMD